MKKDQFNQLIRDEVTKQLKIIVPKLVKPLVQEAVAGALSALLAEGIVKGTPNKLNSKPVEILGPNIPQSKKSRDTNKFTDRTTLRKRFEQLQREPVQDDGTSSQFGGGLVGNILAETAMSMTNNDGVESILDYANELSNELPVDPDTINAITRDYSALMDRLNKK